MCLVTKDTHDLVVDFDHRNHRPQIGFSGLNVAILELFIHQFRECFNALGRDLRSVGRMMGNPVDGDPDDFAFGFEVGYSCF